MRHDVRVVIQKWKTATEAGRHTKEKDGTPVKMWARRSSVVATAQTTGDQERKTAEELAVELRVCAISLDMYQHPALYTVSIKDSDYTIESTDDGRTSGEWVKFKLYRVA